MYRPPVVAGSFYPASEKELRKVLTKYLDQARAETGREMDEQVVAGVAPHAGYTYSGQIAAHLYATLPKEKPRSIVLIGPNHTGMGSGVAIVSRGEWSTPLGTIKIDEALAKEILSYSDIIDDDPTAHKEEHSLEVQIPFIQHIYLETPKMVPITMMLQDYETSNEVGEAVGQAIKKMGDKVIVIASTDFTHAGLAYGDLREYTPEEVESQDMKAIEKILSLDPQGLIDCVQRNNITMCGYGPVAATITASKKLGAKKARLLRYGTSYDVSGDRRAIVGYGAICFTLQGGGGSHQP
ncbi:MAG: hypothetical protein DRO11_01635 [Methanobacteriota archaeon]|nr:MAG: hypothetical protein DRO11_01635 [Euryarchaeota archaeon]